MNFDFLYVFLNNLLVVADALNPDKLVFPFYVFLQVVFDEPPPVFSRIGPIQNCNLVLRYVNVLGQLVKTGERDLISKLYAFLVVSEEIIFEFQVIV